MASKAQAIITLSDEEKNILQEFAKKEGLSVSNFLRKRLGMPLLVKGNYFINNNPKKNIKFFAKED